MLKKIRSRTARVVLAAGVLLLLAGAPAAAPVLAGDCVVVTACNNGG